jgi:hypothetical protein
MPSMFDAFILILLFPIPTLPKKLKTIEFQLELNHPKKKNFEHKMNY